MGSKGEIAVFVETNLGTRIAFPILEGITAAQLKWEVERAHIDIFPELGSLSVRAVMVKQNSHFYHLPDSIHLKNACQGFQNFWLFHADVSLPETLEKASLSGTESVVSKQRAANLHGRKGKKVNKKIAGGKRKKHRLGRFWCLNSLLHSLLATAYQSRKKKRRKTRHLLRRLPAGSSPQGLEPETLGSERLEVKRYFHQDLPDPAQVSDFNATAETPCESFSGAVSVSGIIDRYFTDFIEVDQVKSALCPEVSMRCGQNLPEGQSVKRTSSSKLHDKRQDSSRKTNKKLLCSYLPEELGSVGLRKYERSEVGKRLVTASNSLGPCPNSQGSSLSKGKMLWDSDASSIVKKLVFEIDDND